MYIIRKQSSRLEGLIQPGKVVVLYGPRRVGKTTLVQRYLTAHPTSRALFVSGEERSVREYLESESVEKLKDFIGQHTLLIIDEAQKIKNIGLNLKLIVDHIPGIALVATGSSAFNLAQKIGEPLAGRKFTLKLYPIAEMELADTTPRHTLTEQLERKLIYGMYPESITAHSDSDRALYLRELCESTLYKDILAFDGIRSGDKIRQLIQLLAFQIGKEVSHNELATQLGMSRITVEKYLDILTKAFIILPVSGFSRNLRKEITKTKRYYFLDTGIRNAIINNFNPINQRDDVGALWENFLFMEREKKREYTGLAANTYFWRTYDQKEIDLVEEYDGMLHGYEMKWGNRTPKEPLDWKRAYPGSTYQNISRTNYLDFIL